MLLLKFGLLFLFKFFSCRRKENKKKTKSQINSEIFLIFLMTFFSSVSIVTEVFCCIHLISYTYNRDTRSGHLRHFWTECKDLVYSTCFTLLSYLTDDYQCRNIHQSCYLPQLTACKVLNSLAEVIDKEKYCKIPRIFIVLTSSKK